MSPALWLVRRLFGLVFVMLGVVVIAFSLMHAIPGDIAYVLAGEAATDESIARIRADLGLDRSFLEQLLRYTLSVARGDLGSSISYRVPVIELILSHLPVTLTIAGVAIVLGTVVGLPLGIIASLRRGSALDAVTTAISLVGICSPSFWRGIVLILVFAVQWNVMPPGGLASRGASWWVQLQHFLLPGIAMAMNTLGQAARIARSSMLDTLGMDYVRTARAKGLGPTRVVTRHALRNALLPIITVLGLNFGGLLGGVVVTESVFAMPGLGTLAVNAIGTKDYPVLLGVLLVTALLFALINLVVDMLYMLLDPRVSYA